jgi:photosystem II stability/assembly factor-like uncharacterized protein
LIGTITSSAPSSTATLVPFATKPAIPPGLPVLTSPVLARIDFQDENSGWGIAVNASGYVVRTVDGGRTWLNATPPGTAAIGFSASLTILNANTAWVLVPQADYFSGTLYRTSDGGIIWNSSPVPFGGGFLQFLNASTGRLLADRGAEAGSEAVELFQTSDGGATWVSVFHNDSSQPGSSDSLPLVGVKNGMTFLDANTGWVTGSLPEDGDVYLYVTHDGGASWSQQSLALPAGYAAYQYMPQAPVFFGDNGFLPLLITMPGRTDFTFYVTQDGGLTWSGDPADPNKVIKPGLPAFADALHAWSWDGGTNLFLTTDGAQMWKGNITALDLSGRLSQIQFIPVSADHFTGWALTQVDDSGHSHLYRTTDGSTWTQLIP